MTQGSWGKGLHSPQMTLIDSTKSLTRLRWVLTECDWQRVVFADTEGRKEMFYLTTHSTHFIYGYMASDIW